MYVLMEICLSTEMILLGVKNLSVASATTTHKITSTPIIPVFPVNTESTELPAVLFFPFITLRLLLHTA
jgi:hypothetical protein